ncbi:MAG: hypothetical protein AMXMBFR84_29480 [Candidatus Hydrogenedentota bacterium]
MIRESDILNALRHIIDPDLGRDIVSLGFVKNIEIKGSEVSFTLELTTPACPVKDKFKTQAEEAVAKLPGVASVMVSFSAMAPRERQGSGINTLENIGAVIAVSACKGGVGKSTVAAHLARSMRREGLEVGLLDTDIYGPSVPTLFNLHNPPVAMMNNKIVPVMVDGIRIMSLGFVLGEAPAVLRGPIVSGYTQQILKQTDWGTLDYLIIDMPPGTGDIQLTIVQQAALDGAIIVTTPHSLSLVDVAKGILMFEKVSVPVLGVVENMSHFQCDGCGKVHYPFGRSMSTLQDRFGLPTLAELPIMPGLSELSRADAGADVVQFKQMAENVHRAIGKSRVDRTDPPRIQPDNGSLKMTWPDGQSWIVPNYEIRCACPCARCVDEMSGAPLLNRDTVPRDIGVQAMQQLGNYAVAITWTDGHSTGIFSWDFLKALAMKHGQKVK